MYSKGRDRAQGEDWPMLSMKAYVRDMNRDISVNLWWGIL